MTLKNIYKATIIPLIVIPNIFVMVLGIESFPYTCAPMFGHYIDSKTDLYLLEFEGVNDGKTTNLINYLGKPEDFFMRHFFSKVYGSTKAISPFSNKLSESDEAFHDRMKLFFLHYTKILKDEYHLTFQKINIKAVKVNQDRKKLTEPKIIGFYDTSEKEYISSIENKTVKRYKK
ncbi:hypothetical protein ACFQ1R_00890 [Mariniflexile jejuense]|uniref:Uncharacterized protein n=1 Tax=Mariniflexile jejuense TaxID=1173582 RepID=A0ABW3JGT2_9FLAO